MARDRARLGGAALGLAFALLALACATPPSDEELDAQLRAIAAEVKPRGELRVVSINAESRMDAWTKLAEDEVQGKEHGASQQARRLARAFEKANRLRVAVVTGGPYADLNEQTVRSALDLAMEKHQRMAGLTLVFVSPEPPTPELRATVNRAGSLLVHRTPPLPR